MMEAVGKLSNAQMELLKLFKYDLPEKQLEASTVAIGDTLSGIREVEDDFPANGPVARLKRHPWYQYRGWLLGCVSLLVVIVFFMLRRG